MFPSAVYILKANTIHPALLFLNSRWLFGLSGQFWRSFFIQIHHIGFVHLQNLSCSAPADPAVIHFYCELADFFRLLMLLRINGVVDAALLTFTALTFDAL